MFFDYHSAEFQGYIRSAGLLQRGHAFGGFFKTRSRRCTVRSVVCISISCIPLRTEICRKTKTIGEAVFFSISKSSQ